jgi:hypothetical protein
LSAKVSLSWRNLRIAGTGRPYMLLALTGATGFIGQYLLRELPVPASSPACENLRFASREILPC